MGVKPSRGSAFVPFLWIVVVSAGCKGTTGGILDLSVGGMQDLSVGTDAAASDAASSAEMGKAIDGSSDGAVACVGCKKLWIAFAPDATQRDLQGLFHCLLERTQFNAFATSYPKGYGLQWGGQATLSASCGSLFDGDTSKKYDCAATNARFPVADHDVVLIVYKAHCGGQNNARGDGSVTAAGIRIRGSELGDGTLDNYLQCQDRVAVHETFESVGDWADADCCTGEVGSPMPACATGDALCPSCPCSCGKYKVDGTYGGYYLDCGGGPKQYYAQRVSPLSGGMSEFDPNNCVPFTITN